MELSTMGAAATPIQTRILERMTIHARFSVTGFHRWPDASGEREYLASRHRHRFKYRASITVDHGDREIEFHDFLDWCCLNAMAGELGCASCEHMAQALIGRMREKWPGRQAYVVEVWEDDEVGCTVEHLNC